MIHITEAAAEQLRTLLEEREADDGCGLRLAVEKGGCAGLQYAMTLEPAQEDDVVVVAGDARVFIEAGSREYLSGLTLDFSDDLAGAGFRIRNPNAARSCGCGTSFQPAADQG